MTTAVERSPDLEQGRLAVDAGAAARLAAAGPFDLQVRTLLLGGRSYQPGSGDRPIIPTDSVTTYASGVKLLRSGVVVSTDLSVGRFGDSRLSFPINPKFQRLISANSLSLQGLGGNWRGFGRDV